MFEYLNYSTIYQASGDLVFENKDLEGQACFSYIFRNVRNNKKQHIIYSIYISTDPSYIQDNSENNLCILTEEQIRFHMSYLRFISSFKYKITKKFIDDYSGFRIDLDLNAIGNVHKMFLTWIRYLYEYPYNLVLYDSFKLREEKRFIEKSNYLNIVNFVTVFYSIDWIHQIPKSYYKIPKFITRKSFKDRLMKCDCLNNILENSNIRIAQFTEYDKIDDFIKDFDNRKNKYIETLNKLKQ
mgnify:CR=1 FL=1